MSTTSMNGAGVAIVRAPSGKGFRSKSAALRAQLRAEKAKTGRRAVREGDER